MRGNTPAWPVESPIFYRNLAMSQVQATAPKPTAGRAHVGRTSGRPCRSAFKNGRIHCDGAANRAVAVFVDLSAAKIVMNSQPSPADASSEPQNSASGVAAIPELTPAQQAAIHAAASEFVCAAVQQREAQLPDATLGGTSEMTVLGSFVSLKRAGGLRGCCGFLGRNAPLSEAIELAGRRTATEDVRMPPVSPSELPHLYLESWLLYQLEVVLAQGEARRDEVQIGRHGLRIALGEQSGLLLPSVAVEQNYSAEEFLEAVCVKAGLPPTSWKSRDCQLYRFEGRSFGGPIAADAIARGGVTVGEILSRENFQQLAQFCYDGIHHSLRGSASNYFITGVPDGMVNARSAQLARRGRRRRARHAAIAASGGSAPVHITRDGDRSRGKYQTRQF